MTEHTEWGGAWKTCPQCQKLFFVTDCERWVYKRTVTNKDGGKLKHFCKYSCMRKFDKEYEERKSKQRKEAAKRQGWGKKKNL